MFKIIKEEDRRIPVLLESLERGDVFKFTEETELDNCTFQGYKYYRFLGTVVLGSDKPTEVERAYIYIEFFMDGCLAKIKVDKRGTIWDTKVYKYDVGVEINEALIDKDEK